MDIMVTKESALQSWLLILAGFELIEIYRYLVQNVPIDGFFSTLKNNRAEKRLWCMLLSFLALTRVHAAFNLDNSNVLIFNAVVHILEALVFGYEKFVHSSNGGSLIFAVIVFNASWFLLRYVIDQV